VFERERGLVNVIVDEPHGGANSIPSVWEVTNDHLALLRLHGRNHATWNIQGTTASSDRFNYGYDDDKLAGLATQIYEISKAVAQTHFSSLIVGLYTDDCYCISCLLPVPACIVCRVAALLLKASSREE